MARPAKPRDETETARDGRARPGHAFAGELDYVHRTLRRHGVPAADAEDVAQEVFLIAWRRQDDFDPSRALRPWLGGIAFKLAHQYHRRRKPALVGEEEVVEGTPPAALEPAALDARALVLRVLARLPERYREVLVAHEVDGLSVDDLAARWRVPRFTLYTRLRRARLAFAAEVKAIEAAGKRPAQVRALAPGLLLTLKRDVPRGLPAGRSWLVGLAAASCVLVPGLALVAARSTARAAHRAGVTVAAATLNPAVVPAAPAPRRGPPRLLSPPPPEPSPDLRAGLGRDLVGHWSFEDGRGSVRAIDRSPGHHACELHRLDPAAAWIPGAAGGGLELGFNGWLECPQAALPSRATAAFTVALWVKRAGNPHHHRALVTRRMDAERRNYFFFGFDGDRLVVSSSGFAGTLTAPFREPPGTWVHVAFSHDADRVVRLYISGHEVARQRGGVRSFGSTRQPLRVGGGLRSDAPGGVGQLFEGAVDELLVYERALEPHEIAALATAP